MTPEQFLSGRLKGFGCVQGPTGRVLRRYTVELHGVWSDEHRALHLDETYIYRGREDDPQKRSWVVHTDEEGFVLGQDALQAARLRGRMDGEDLRMVFDRPSRPGGRTISRQTVRLVTVGPDRIMMLGRLLRFGVPVASMHTALIREAD